MKPEINKDKKFQEINALSVANKHILYLDYVLTQICFISLTLYVDFTPYYGNIVLYEKLNKQFPTKPEYGRKDPPDIRVHNIGINHPAKDSHIMSFEEFFDLKNIRMFDHGEQWKEKYFAQRYQVDYFGAYDWYWKFKSRIKFWED